LQSLWHYGLYRHLVEIDPETGEGNFSDAIIQEQMDILNNDYSGRGEYHNMNWRFSLRNVTRVANERWFQYMGIMELIYKPRYADDVYHNLHIYTGWMNGGVLGMCFFSYMFPENSSMHGCLINYQSMVHGGATPYDSGQTAAHEIGHHLGLFHVWQGRCIAPWSDRVDDTPPQYTNSRLCPDPIPQSCTPGQYDNIHNFMDYSDDDCRWYFSEGQSARSDVVIATFHPGYMTQEDRVLIDKLEPTAWDRARAYSKRRGGDMMAAKSAEMKASGVAF